MFNKENEMENRMIAFVVVAFIVVMAVALALTLNNAAIHGWVK